MTMFRYLVVTAVVWAAAVVAQSSSTWSSTAAASAQALAVQAPPAKAPPATPASAQTPPSTAVSAQSAPLPPGFAGTDTCVTCHDPEGQSITHSRHGQAKNPRSPAATLGCESCH